MNIENILDRILEIAGIAWIFRNITKINTEAILLTILIVINNILIIIYQELQKYHHLYSLTIIINTAHININTHRNLSLRKIPKIL
jgi:hypothetical protein